MQTPRLHRNPKIAKLLADPNIEWKNLAFMNFPTNDGSNNGLIRSTKTNYITMGSLKKTGYRIASMRDGDGKRRNTISVHIAVARAFIGEPPTDKHTVDHRNRIRDDNRHLNMRWATKSEQCYNQNADRFRPGRPVTQILPDGTEYATWFSVRDAAVAVLGQTDDNLSMERHIHYAVKSGSTLHGFSWRWSLNTLPGEIWSPVQNPDLQYRIYGSNRGRICNVDKQKITYGGTTADGYKVVFLKLKNGKTKSFRVHRLIITIALGPDKRFVNHKNGNKRDNRPENLEYMTCEENNKHAHDTGLNRAKYNNELSKAVKRMDMQGNIIGIYPSQMEADRQTGTKYASISEVCLGKKPWANNSIWAFIGLNEYPVVDEEALKLFNDAFPTKRVNNKPVSVYDANGTFIKTFKLMKDASEFTKVSVWKMKKYAKLKEIVDGYGFVFEK